MKKVGSIALADLATQIQKSVAGLERKHSELISDGLEVRFVPDPGIIGFILREEVARDLSVRQIEETAGAFARSLAPVAGDKAASVLVRPGGIIVGFFPIDVIAR